MPSCNVRYYIYRLWGFELLEGTLSYKNCLFYRLKTLLCKKVTESTCYNTKYRRKKESNHIQEEQTPYIEKIRSYITYLLNYNLLIEN